MPIKPHIRAHTLPRGVARLVPGPDQDPRLVHLTDTIAAEARSGALRGIAGVCIYRGNQPSHFWSFGRGLDYTRVQSELNVLGTRLMLRHDPDIRDELRSLVHDL